jgi:hypothetical protein
MAFTKFTRIILYVVAGISLLVILFFYLGPKTVNYNQLEATVEDVLNPQDMAPALVPVTDTAAQDSATMEEVTAPVEAESTPEAVETVISRSDLREHISGWEYLVWFRTDIALIWTYILVVITLLSAIVFPLIAVVTNTKALIRLVAVLAGAAVLIIIAYLASSDTPIDIIGYTGTDNSDPAILKMIDTVLFVTYMLFGLAIASILYAIIARAFK